MVTDAHRLIRGNNRVWARIYYDEVVDRGGYQLTCLAGAESPFYSCAQAIGTLTDDDFAAIEAFYRQRGLPSALYLDPQSDRDLARRACDRGYAETPAEREHWWRLPLDARLPAIPDPASLDIEVVPLVASPAYDDFIHVDALGNEVSETVREKLRHNLLERSDPEVELHLLLGRVGAEAVATGAVAIHDGRAWLAEGATQPGWRRRGFHRALVQRRLEIARGAGASEAVLVCTAGAWSNRTAASLGFERSFERRLLVARG